MHEEKLAALSCKPDNIYDRALPKHLRKYLGKINNRVCMSLGPWQWTGTPVAAEEHQVVLPPQQQAEKPRAFPGQTPGERTEPRPGPREGERKRERQRKGAGERKRTRKGQ